MPWLVTGLGNPGPQYELTLHNLGFLTIDRMAVRNGIRVTQPDSRALVGFGKIGGEEVMLAKPQTFMNVCGPSVEALLTKHGVRLENLVVIYDELDIAWTGLRVRPGGSSGGHNGVKSLIASLRSQEFARIRLGIDPGHAIAHGADFVLSPFRKAQLQELDELLDHASAAAESLIAEGVEKSMTKFNRRARG
ncbi:MAG: aminoacyl-tRNA hydrolase [Bryobacteraceae bacterium]